MTMPLTVLRGSSGSDVCAAVMLIQMGVMVALSRHSGRMITIHDDPSSFFDHHEPGGHCCQIGHNVNHGEKEHMIAYASLCRHGCHKPVWFGAASRKSW